MSEIEFVEKPEYTHWGNLKPERHSKVGRTPRAKLSKKWYGRLEPEEILLAQFLIRSCVYSIEDRRMAISPFISVTNTHIQVFKPEVNEWENSKRVHGLSINDRICFAVEEEYIHLDVVIANINLLLGFYPKRTKRIKELDSVKQMGEFTHTFDEEIKELPDNEREQAEYKRKKQLENLLAKQTQDLEELYKESGNAVPSNIEGLLKQLMSQGNSSGDQGEGDREGQAESQSKSSSPPPELKSETPLEEFLRRMKEVIRYLDKGDGPRDVVSNAVYKFGGRMIKAGIPVSAIMHAYALTWPQHAREELEIESYNISTYGNSKDDQHYAVPYVEAMVNAGIHVMLVGPTQAGKGYLSHNIAENRGLQYGSVPLSAGTSISWLFGRNMPKGFVSTDLIRCYEDGGVFLLDEMDAADSNLLLGINDALSNHELSNPVIDMRIKKHENFIPLAAANTWGLGADADYTGRERLDMATLERWRMGRVEINYDRDLQVKIATDEAKETT